MQKLTPIAIVIGAVVIAAALVFHGIQLASVAGRLETLEQRTGELDVRLNSFSEELPVIVGRAGKDAGRQAVHGVVEEAFQKPLGRLMPGLTHATSNLIKRADGQLSLKGLIPEGGIPLIRFDIPDPVINIEILTHLKDLPSLPWFTPKSNSTQPDATNQNTQADQTAPSTGQAEQ